VISTHTKARHITIPPIGFSARAMRFALQRERERQSKKFQELSTEQKAPTIKRRRRRRRPF
jgi:hypothetical protein